MKSDTLIIIFILLTLGACGGGGGSIDKENVAINSLSSSTSSSISSSSATATCANIEGAVFIDEACGAWENPSFYEQNRTNFTGGENTTGIGNNLNLSVIYETESSQNKVIDIHYGNNSIYSTIPRLLNNPSLVNGVDLSEYANGSLQFDLKVIDPGVNNPSIQLIIECAWPCASTFDIIEPGPLNTWKSFEIPVAHLIDRGLDIEKITTGFQIMPEWTTQNGVHLQVDNIRWVKKNLQTPEANICYSNYLRGPQGDDNYVDLSLLGGSGSSEAVNITNAFATLTFAPKWNLSNTYSIAVGKTINKLTLLPDDTDAISKCSTGSTLMFDIYLDKGYTNNYPLSIGIALAGINSSKVSLERTITNADFTSGQWTKIYIPVAINQSGLHQVVFDITGPVTNENLGAIMIDNIRIIKPAL
jgi:hypothetical protein